MPVGKVPPPQKVTSNKQKKPLLGERKPWHKQPTTTTKTQTTTTTTTQTYDIPKSVRVFSFFKQNNN